MEDDLTDRRQLNWQKVTWPMQDELDQEKMIWLIEGDPTDGKWPDQCKTTWPLEDDQIDRK